MTFDNGSLERRILECEGCNSHEFDQPRSEEITRLCQTDTVAAEVAAGLGTYTQKIQGILDKYDFLVGKLIPPKVDPAFDKKVETLIASLNKVESCNNFDAKDYTTRGVRKDVYDYWGSYTLGASFAMAIFSVGVAALHHYNPSILPDEPTVETICTAILFSSCYKLGMATASMKSKLSRLIVAAEFADQDIKRYYSPRLYAQKNCE